MVVAYISADKLTLQVLNTLLLSFSSLRNDTRFKKRAIRHFYAPFSRANIHIIETFNSEYS